MFSVDTVKYTTAIVTYPSCMPNIQRVGKEKVWISIQCKIHDDLVEWIGCNNLNQIRNPRP